MRTILPEFAAFVLLLVSAPLASQQPQAATGFEAEVRAAAQAFHDALSRGDSVTVLAYLHDDVRILEGSSTETKEQYRSGHLAGDIRYLSSVQSETLREGVTLTGDVALYTRQYRVTGASSRGAPIDRTATEALVLVRTPAGWRIRNVHWF